MQISFIRQASRILSRIKQTNQQFRTGYYFVNSDDRLGALLPDAVVQNMSNNIQVAA